MKLTSDQLRESIDAIAKDVADAYVRFDSPFDEDEVAGRFSRLAGVHSAVADRLAVAYRSMHDDFGDGGKTALLITCGIVRAALDRLPAEGRDNFATALDVATGRPADSVAKSSRLLRSPADVRRAATTAAGGDTALGAALLEAIAKAGKDGRITVACGGADEPSGLRVIDGEIGSEPFTETVVVRGDTEEQTATLYRRACTTLHATVAAIALGVVQGGGVAYALAAQSLREEPDDTNTGLAARAVGIGLEWPLRTRAGGADVQKMLTALGTNPDRAFDQVQERLVPAHEGAIDPLRIVQAAIREAGRSACDLLRMVA